MIAGVKPENVIRKIRVVTGKILATLDKAGTLTRKYQARLSLGDMGTELVSHRDTKVLRHIVRSGVTTKAVTSPASNKVRLRFQRYRGYSPHANHDESDRQQFGCF